jgi:hypothetical protein
MTSDFWTFPRLLKLFGLMITYVGLLATAAVAVWLGTRDLFVPVSLSAQLVGLSFLLAGAACLAGFAVLVAKTNMPGRKRVAALENWQVILAGVGVLAGLYVDITVAVYSFRYEPIKSGIFGMLALLDLLLATWLLPVIRPRWRKIGRGFAGAGALAAVVAVGAQFWYQSVYISQSTQVGIEYSLNAGPVILSGGTRFITLKLTMQNVSPVTAIALNSMLVVTGISYENGPNSGLASPALTQQNMVAYAQTLSSKTFNFSISKLPDIGFSGHLAARMLAAWRPVGNNTYFFPGTTYTRDFVVAIPGRDIRAIDARVKIIYARAARLTPGALLSSGMRHYSSCRNSEQFAYYINESALRRFTNGHLIFITNWCADVVHPDISFHITRALDMSEPANTESALISHYGVVGNTHIQTFVLGPSAGAIP